MRPSSPSEAHSSEDYGHLTSGVSQRDVGTLASIPTSRPADVTRPSLRIAVLAPIAWRTPPRHYGPWELFASLLADGLVSLGHEVTLFATAHSQTTARLHGTATRGWSEDPDIDPKVAECMHIAEVFEHARDFDIIHNGFDFLPLTYSGLVDTPVVTTIHGFSSSRIIPVYERYDPTTTYVAISDADRHPRWTTPQAIHHGIDVDSFTLQGEPVTTCSSSAGSTPTRAPPTRSRSPGVQVGASTSPASLRTRSTSMTRSRPTSTTSPSRVTSGPSMQPIDQMYSAAHTRPATSDRLRRTLRLSVVEAMACGTPVIAYDRGSMREIIDDEATGFLRRKRRKGRHAAVELAGRVGRQRDPVR